MNFWFGTPGSEDTSYAGRRKLWFGKSSEVDEYIRTAFYTLYTQAALGELDGWQAQPESCLALILLLDQFPRNLFRQKPQAFATDEQALRVAKWAIAHGFDQQLNPLQRLFIYLPLEHSEVLEDQHKAVALIEALVQEDPALADPYDYALRHRDVIARFSRFPHRNEILGRISTPEEEVFLKQPGSRF
nr:MULTISPECIES: DUF924 family protein [unclassified Leptolyngbya]